MLYSNNIANIFFSMLAYRLSVSMIDLDAKVSYSVIKQPLSDFEISQLTGFVTIVTRRLSHVEQEQFTLSGLLRSSSVLVGFVLLDL